MICDPYRFIAGWCRRPSMRRRGSETGDAAQYCMSCNIQNNPSVKFDKKRGVGGTMEGSHRRRELSMVVVMGG